LVAWQSSHVLVLAMWLMGLPGAVMLLWQLAQLPRTARWSTWAGIHALVEWQSRQVLALAT
jgi:hypothetical protein